MNIIVSNRERTVDKILRSAMLPVRELLPDALIENLCRKVGHEWRERVFNPVVTVLVCVWKHLQPGSVSLRACEDFAASLAGLPAASKPRDGKDVCLARARLPEGVFQAVTEQVGAVAQRTAALVYRGLRVVMGDGTTVRTPNTAALEERFGCSRNAVRQSRSPLLRIVLLICAGCSAVLNVRIGAYAASEPALFLQLVAHFTPDMLFLGDRGYAAFVLLSMLRRQQAQFVVRVSSRLLTNSKRTLGYRDDVRAWLRPSPSQTVFAHLLEHLPESMEVRVIERTIRRAGYRTWTLRIATSLLDPAQYPAEELIDLYLRRWRIETALRTLKTHGHWAHLTGKTPDIARKEIHCAVLAHNCVCALMAQSGEAPELLSPKRVRELIQTYAGHMCFAATAHLPTLFKALLRMIATALQLPQKRGPEPRAIVQRPSTFPVLMTSRDEWKRRQRSA